MMTWLFGQREKRKYHALQAHQQQDLLHANKKLDRLLRHWRVTVQRKIENR